MGDSSRGRKWTAGALVAVVTSLLVAFGLFAWWPAGDTPASVPGPGGTRPAPPDPQESGEGVVLRDATDARGPERIAVGTSRDELGARMPDDATLLRGRILDPEDRPVPGLRVELRRRQAGAGKVPDFRFPSPEHVLAETSSDAEGEFVFEVAPGVSFQLHVPADPHPVYAPRVIVDCLGGRFVIVRLTRAALVRGRVTRAADGAPIPGTRVRLYGGDVMNPVVWAATTTDAEGGYRIEGLAASEYTMEAVPPADPAPPWKSFSVAPGEEHVLDLEVVEGFTLVGFVVDAGTRLPVAGAEVGDGWAFLRSTRTDATGYYVLEGVGTDFWPGIHARAEGYGRLERARPEPENGEARLDFELLPARRILGRLLDSSDEPLAGGRATAVASSFEGTTPRIDWPSAVSGDDGRFEIADARADLPHCVLLAADGFSTLVFDLPPDELERRELDLGDIRMRPPAWIAGRIVEESGEAVAGAYVELRGWNKDRLRFGRSERLHAVDSYVGWREKRTGPDGAFHFGELAPGSYELAVRAAGRPPIPDETIEVSSGEGITDLEVVAPPLGPIIAGQVIDADGEGIEGAALHLTAEQEGGTDRFTWSRRGGLFRLSGLAPGTYTIEVSVPHHDDDGEPLPPTFAEARIEKVVAGTEDLLIRLSPIR